MLHYYMKVGCIGRRHGLAGFVYIYLCVPVDMIYKGILHLEDNTKLNIVESKNHKQNKLCVKFDGYDYHTSATLNNKEIFSPSKYDAYIGRTIHDLNDECIAQITSVEFFNNDYMFLTDTDMSFVKSILTLHNNKLYCLHI